MAAFQAIYIQGERWIVNSTIPLTELSQPLDTMMEILVGIAVLYMVLLITQRYTFFITGSVPYHSTGK